MSISFAYPLFYSLQSRQCYPTPGLLMDIPGNRAPSKLVSNFIRERFVGGTFRGQVTLPPGHFKPHSSDLRRIRICLGDGRNLKSREFGVEFGGWFWGTQINSIKQCPPLFRWVPGCSAARAGCGAAGSALAWGRGRQRHENH